MPTDWPDVHSGAIQAAATIILIAVTIYYAWQAKRQADEVARQEKIANQQRFDAQRPVICPIGELPLNHFRLDWTAAEHEISLRNFGSGVALTTCGLLFPPRAQLPSNIRPPEYSFWHQPPLGPGESRPAKLQLGGTLIPGDAQLAGHELYAPPKPSQYELMVMGQYNIVARLTITWEDVFKRKHAGIYDYIDVFGWYCVGLFEDTERDLEDLNDHARSGALASAGIPAQTE
jgi:hypothetical protein